MKAHALNSEGCTTNRCTDS